MTTTYAPSKTVTEAIKTRRSLRDFLATPVSSQLIFQILETASRAPSGTNMQPWQVYVLTDDAKEKVCDAVCHAFDDEPHHHTSEKSYYPKTWFEPFVSRRRKVGWDLYGLLNIEKGDKDKMRKQHRRNFRFFDAPVGLIFTVHRDLETGSWLDYGMFLQNIMLLAREAGLHSCPQAAWADYHLAIRQALAITDEEMVVCGMALGYGNPDAIENSLETEREPVAQFAQFLS